MQVLHHLESEDYAAHMVTCQDLIEAVHNEHLLAHALFSEDSTFHTCDLVNRHNSSIWADEQPHIAMELERNIPNVNVLLKQQSNSTSYLDMLDALFSNDSTFHTCDLVNRHNSRIWADEQPHIAMELERNIPKVNVLLKQQSNSTSYLDMLDALFSDDSTFHTCDLVNRHNSRIWADEQPHNAMELERNIPKGKCVVEATIKVNIVSGHA